MRQATAHTNRPAGKNKRHGNMNNTLIIKLTAFLTALLCMVSCTVGGDDDNEYGKGMLEEGTIAPDFMIYTDSRPEGFALSSLRGQYVLIEFWASWCPDCQKETENMKQMYATYAPQGVVFVGVSFDTDRDQWQQYISENGLSWIQFSELKPWKESSISTAYNIRWIPTLYLIDKDGRVVLGTVSVAEMSSRLTALGLSGQ